VFNSPYIVGAVAGVASALLLAGGSRVTVLGPLLFFSALLPAFLAGLGWGPRALVAMGGALLVVTAALRDNLLFALVLALVVLSAVWLLSWLAHQSRTAAATTASAPAVDWYPPGHLLLWMAAIAAAVGATGILALASSEPELIERAKDIVQAFKRDLSRAGGTFPEMPAGELDALAHLFARLLPAVAASSWLAVIALNFYLAARILRGSGRLARPWPDLAASTLPKTAPLLLAASGLATMIPGLPGILAGSLLSALLTAFMLVGLAVLHYITRGSAYRPFILAATYIGMIATLPKGGALAMALVGLADVLFDFRSRFGPRQPGAPT
jgi:hypothetical protein